MSKNEMIDRLEELAEVIALNPDRWLSSRRMKHMVGMMKKSGFSTEASKLVVEGNADSMVDSLRQASASIGGW